MKKNKAKILFIENLLKNNRFLSTTKYGLLRLSFNEKFFKKETKEDPLQSLEFHFSNAVKGFEGVELLQGNLLIDLNGSENPMYCKYPLGDSYKKSLSSSMGELKKCFKHKPVDCEFCKKLITLVQNIYDTYLLSSLDKELSDNDSLLSMLELSECLDFISEITIKAHSLKLENIYPVKSLKSYLIGIESMGFLLNYSIDEVNIVIETMSSIITIIKRIL